MVKHDHKLRNINKKSIEYKHILNHIFKKNPTIENRLKCSTFNNKLTLLLRIRENEYYSRTIRTK